MKQLICRLLILSLALCLFACTEKEPELKAPVRFYYPRSQTVQGKDDGVISWELRESVGHETDYAYLLGLYLQGPDSDTLSHIFRGGITLENLTIGDTYAVVVLSDSFAQLSGLSLTLACACLTATVSDLTGVQTVTVRTQTLPLDGSPFISMDRSKLLLWDNTAVPEEQN